MDLWIRSKSKKTLVKINAISLSSCSEDYVIESDSDYVLGKYPKERALEILDEIQKLLLPKVKVNTYEIEHSNMNMMYFVEHAISDFNISQSSTYVYEMPEE